MTISFLNTMVSTYTHTHVFFFQMQLFFSFFSKKWFHESSSSNPLSSFLLFDPYPFFLCSLFSENPLKWWLGAILRYTCQAQAQTQAKHSSQDKIPSFLPTNLTKHTKMIKHSLFMCREDFPSYKDVFLLHSFSSNKKTQWMYDAYCLFSSWITRAPPPYSN